jgi:tetratricopeptide (TPR) repeat protein
VAIRGWRRRAPSRADANPLYRWIASALIVVAVPVLVIVVAGYQRTRQTAGQEATARQEAAQLRALEERVLLHPGDSDALAALAQIYEGSGRRAEAAALRARLTALRSPMAPMETTVTPDPAARTQLPSVHRAPLFARLDPVLPPSSDPALRRTHDRPPQQSPLATLIERAAREPDNLALQREVVSRCQDRDWLPAAIPALKRLAQAEPDNGVTWRRLGVAELQAGRPGAARDALRVAVAKAPRDAVAHFFLGLAHSGRAEVPEALAAFARVQALRPDYTPAALERVRLQIEDWRLAGAVAEARRLVKQRPRLAEARLQLGVALFHLHDLAGAESALREAVRLDPGPTRYAAWLGMTILERGRIDEAIAVLEGVVARSPASTNSLYQLGRAYLLRGRREDAERALRQTLILDPRDPQACFKLRQVFTQQGRRDEAALLRTRFQSLTAFEQRRNYIERHAQAQPHRPEWRRRLGDLYAREGMLREARAQYERAAELQGRHAER